jgi:hypothetical protein
VSLPFPDPTDRRTSHAEVLLSYLDYFRSVIVDKVQGLPEAELRSSRLSSGWTPLGLIKHLTYVEIRWLVWGFAGQPIEDPWADSRDGRWFTSDEEHPRDLIDSLHRQATQTRGIVEAHQLTDRGQPGPRWPDAEPATLERVLLHLTQEYARHVGHLDIVRELIDGQTGE